VNREYRVKQMGKPYPMSFGHEPEQSPITVKAPRPPLFDDIQPRFVVSVKQLVRNFSTPVLVRELKSLGAVPLDIDDSH
jgi:hypothetical protein